jgi:hypothetical protein
MLITELFPGLRPQRIRAATNLQQSRQATFFRPDFRRARNLPALDDPWGTVVGGTVLTTSDTDGFVVIGSHVVVEWWRNQHDLPDSVLATERRHVRKPGFNDHAKHFDVACLADDAIWVIKQREQGVIGVLVPRRCGRVSPRWSIKGAPAVNRPRSINPALRHCRDQAMVQFPRHHDG